jgi:uncharacterized protein YegL
MENKHQVHNLIILDESGSMGSIRSLIMKGFNELVQTIHEVESQFPEQEHFITFVSFNRSRQIFHHFVDSASKLENIDDNMYSPNGGTPLFDAMGGALNKLRLSLEGKENYNVLVTILTDGEENASVEFSGEDIKNLVEELKEKNWTFTYIGTDHDVEQLAEMLSIPNKLRFSKDKDGIDDMFRKEKIARMKYSQKIRTMEDIKSKYFDDDAENNRD